MISGTEPDCDIVGEVLRAFQVTQKLQDLLKHTSPSCKALKLSTEKTRDFTGSLISNSLSLAQECTNQNYSYEDQTSTLAILHVT